MHIMLIRLLVTLMFSSTCCTVAFAQGVSVEMESQELFQSLDINEIEAQNLTIYEAIPGRHITDKEGLNHRAYGLVELGATDVGNTYTEYFNYFEGTDVLDLEKYYEAYSEWQSKEMSFPDIGSEEMGTATIFVGTPDAQVCPICSICLGGTAKIISSSPALVGSGDTWVEFVGIQGNEDSDEGRADAVYSHSMHAKLMINEIINTMLHKSGLQDSFVPFIGYPTETVAWETKASTIVIVVPSEMFRDEAGLWDSFEITILHESEPVTNSDTLEEFGIVRVDAMRAVEIAVTSHRYAKRGLWFGQMWLGQSRQAPRPDQMDTVLSRPAAVAMEKVFAQRMGQISLWSAAMATSTQLREK